MEKIININFQGRVIPIEETAYNNLKQYTDSLRRHFAGEESSDEIIHDIENRIAELLSERVKQGAFCIGMNDLNAVIDSIGRLEDIEAAEGEELRDTQKPYTPPGKQAVRGRFFRNTDDKVIAGVCSGIAIQTGIDPVVVRVLFVLLIGALFPIYLLLWIIVPAQSIQSNITRRLYRNPEDKMIAGVCGGLAVYFNTDTWIPRLIFVLPLLVGIMTRGMHAFWWHHGIGAGPRIFAGSFGSTLLILYIILWIALPYASSATDKLEMRGEKIDMNSIKAATQAQMNSGLASPRHEGYGIGRVIGIIFKAFFLLIAGSLALGLFGVLIGLVFAGTVAVPFTDFVLSGVAEYTMAWVGLGLFLGIPFLALTIWIVRRLMGVRSHRHYLGYVFAGLWVIGLISALTITGIIVRNFSSRSMVENEFPLHQPSVSKLYVNVNSDKGPSPTTHHGRWYGDWDDNDAPFQIVNNDSLWLTTVKVNVTQSPDSLFHVYETRISRGNTSAMARNFASHIPFTIDQQDSVISLPRGFCISYKDKFRNQQVLVTIEMPLGKTIQFNKDINKYRWFNINTEGRNFYYDGNWDEDNNYRHSSEYIMTPSGLKNPKDSTDSKSNEIPD